MSKPVPEKIRETISTILDMPAEKVTSEMALPDMEGWDSFTHLQIVLTLESELGVQIDPQRIPKLTTVDLLRQEFEARGAILS